MLIDCQARKSFSEVFGGKPVIIQSPSQEASWEKSGRNLSEIMWRGMPEAGFILFLKYRLSLAISYSVYTLFWFYILSMY